MGLPIARLDEYHNHHPPTSSLNTAVKYQECHNQSHEVKILDRMIIKNDIQGVKKYVQRGCHVTTESCFTAAEYGRGEILLFILQYCYDPECIYHYTDDDTENFVEKIAQRLIKKDHHVAFALIVYNDIHTPLLDEEGYTAVEHGSVLCLKMMLEKYQETGKKTPMDLLFYSFVLGQTNCFRALYKHLSDQQLPLLIGLSTHVIGKVHKLTMEYYRLTQKTSFKDIKLLKKTRLDCIGYVNLDMSRDPVAKAQALCTLNEWHFSL